MYENLLPVYDLSVKIIFPEENSKTFTVSSSEVLAILVPFKSHCTLVIRSTEFYKKATN